MQDTPSFGVVIVAAGRGERAGAPGGGPKQYRLLGSLTVIARTLRAFREWDSECPIIIVRHADDGALLDAALNGDATGTTTVVGGATRQDSVRLGLAALAESENPPTHVLIHDAARPFVSAVLLDALAQSVRDDPRTGAIPALPVSETVKAADADGMIARTVPRQGLYRAQTPQVFPLETILDVHQRAANEHDFEFTDDASLFEWASLPVRIVPGESANVKLTFPEDFTEAERMLKADESLRPSRRAGRPRLRHAPACLRRPHYPVRRRIAHDRRLSGHSDADVGFHALTDALLATIGAGDIGSHFPPSDPQWKGASSDIFLDHAASLVRDAGGTITHCDVTLLCETPKIGPHRDAMRAAIAKVVGIDIGAGVGQGDDQREDRLHRSPGRYRRAGDGDRGFPELREA